MQSRIDNPEILATRHRTQTNKTRNTSQKTKTMNDTDPTKNRSRLLVVFMCGLHVYLYMISTRNSSSKLPYLRNVLNMLLTQPLVTLKHENCKHTHYRTAFKWVLFKAFKKIHFSIMIEYLWRCLHPLQHDTVVKIRA